MSDYNSDASIKIKVVRASVDSVSLYEITDYELEIFEEGSPTDIFLNFAIFSFSIGVSFLTNLLTVKIDNIYLFSVFFIITIIGLSSSLLLFLLWKNSHSRTRDLCKKIRGRLATFPAGIESNTSNVTDDIYADQSST